MTTVVGRMATLAVEQAKQHLQPHSLWVVLVLAVVHETSSDSILILMSSGRVQN